MKRFLLVMVMVFAFASVSMAADIALRATWTANSPADAAIGYRLFRVDGVRTQVGADIPGRTTTSHNFTVTVPDNSTGTLRFVLVAYSPTKVSADSVAANYPFDLTPAPAAPGGFGIMAQ